MATTLVVSFVFGRYHATPWGRHVNEGAVELPPSPWRLLRALYSVWKTRVPDLDESTVAALLTRLAEPPTYHVPPFRLAHTRHYYPKGAGGNPDRTLDAFAVFEPNAELGIEWPFDLEPEQRKALERLASSMPYLGRADSLCEARVEDDWTPLASSKMCAPHDIGASQDESTSSDVVRLLSPTIPLDLEALTARPLDVRSKKLLFPPGTRFATYVKPAESAAPPMAAARPRVPLGAIRYSVLNRVQPSMAEMVTLTHLLRQAVLSRLTDEHPAYWWFAGKGSNGEPLKGHLHSHYLALPDKRHRVGELAIWLPDSGVCDEDVLRLLSGITELHDSDGRKAAIRMSGFGPSGEVLSEYAGPSQSWTSATPFAPTGHRKADWRRFVGRRLQRELAYRDALPDEAEVSFVDGPGIRVAARRPYESGLHTPTPTWLRIRFDQPVEGPIVLGRLAHFGLGLFKVEA